MIESVPLRTSITPAMLISPYFDLTINTVALGLIVVAIRRIRRREKAIA
jgi:hypothetical protein